MSGFKPDGQKSIHESDITISKGNQTKVIEVPIFEPSNFGEKMAIDEKQIGEDFSTLMSNRTTGKIAMICQSVSFSEIRQVFEKHSLVMDQVKSVTRDLSPLYEKVCTELFGQAIQIADKFHVIRNLLEASQAVRIRYRQTELEKRRIAYKEFKLTEQERLKESERNGKVFRAQKFHYKEQRYENSETALELLARSRYLLFKYPDQWTSRQCTRATILFRLFPEIHLAYQLSCQFRDFLSSKNIGAHYLKYDRELHDWYDNVEASQIDEMLNFKTMVETNEQIITNYFIHGETNALAECTNRKIQKFISSNQGTRDRDFFYFRLKNFYS